MKNITLSKAFLISFCVSGLIILWSTPSLSVVVRMPSSSLQGDGNFTLPNFEPIVPGPIPSPSASPGPPATISLKWKVVANNKGVYQWQYDFGCRPPGDAPVLKDQGDGFVNYTWKSDGSSAGGWGDSTTPGNSPVLNFSSTACPSGQPDGTPAPTGDPVWAPYGSPAPSSSPSPSSEPNPSGSPAPGGPSGGDKPKNGEDDKGYKSTKPNFIAYGMKILSKKFPFDVFGTPGEAGESVCPTLEILDKKFELCIILDALKMLKIPTIIAFIIWSVQSL